VPLAGRLWLLSQFAVVVTAMGVRLAHGAARLRIIVQLDAQAANRDMQEACGVGAIAVAALQRTENMLSLNLG